MIPNSNITNIDGYSITNHVCGERTVAFQYGFGNPIVNNFTTTTTTTTIELKGDCMAAFLMYLLYSYTHLLSIVFYMSVKIRSQGKYLFQVIVLLSESLFKSLIINPTHGGAYRSCDYSSV